MHIGERLGERQGVVSGEGEDLARSRGENANCAADFENEDDRRQSARGGVGASCILEGRDEGKTGRCLQDGSQITHVVQESDQHDKTERSVNQGSRDHAPGDDPGGILDFLG